MTPQELPGYLNRMQKRLEDRGPKEAADAMGRVYHRHLATDVLVRNSHPRGTPTTAAPGEPPALVSGTLKRSLRQTGAIAVGAYRAMSKVAPHIIYARIQEMGGTIVAKGKMLHWTDSGGDHFAQSVTLPKRPYMKPARRDVIANGSLRRAAMGVVDRLVRGG